MEFVQFEPVVTVAPEACRGMEMPTAMMGDGARLLNDTGERFMLRYNPEHAEKRIEKAKLSLCIQREIDEGRGFPGGTVRFDTTSVPAEKLESYVSHMKRLRGAGLEPTRKGPLVCPAAHSEMGGVFIDADGWTGVPGLYACGEATGGVHGASRLAGNGGGETIAMGWLVGRTAGERILAACPERRRDHERAQRIALERLAGGDVRDVSPNEIKSEIRGIMGSAAGLYRQGDELEAAAARLEACRSSAEALAAPDLRTALEVRSARNMALIASLIVRAARLRTESRGAHQRRDHPEQDDARWQKHIAFELAPDGSVRNGDLAVH
jgi:succinate dehydrogenase/fumarate reductase flavoprotein subunit